MSGDTVVVTGASGFIAKHCIAELTKRGYAVRGTLRDGRRSTSVVPAVARAGGDASRVSFATADLLAEDGWAEALRGARYVLHVASPFPMDPPRDKNDVIRPAREGTLRVLEAARKAGVERVVLTSSVVAVTLGRQPRGHVYTEADWSDPDRPDITAYAASKTLAEKAAWTYVGGTPGAPELTVINPAFVLGPALDADLSTSHEVLRLMARGVYPAAPKVGFPVSDVRDVAKLHADAVSHPRSAGERFIAATGFLSLMDLGRKLVEVCPDLAGKAPRFELPDIAVRAAALFDTRLRAVLPDLGHPRPISDVKVRETFGIALRPPEQAAASAAQSLRDLGLV